MGITDPCVLVEGPAWGDAEFYGEWLLAAAKAEAFWKEAFTDQDFKKQVERVCVCYLPDFGIAATIMIMELREHRTRFVLDVNSEDGEDFTMMVAMGFFAQKHQYYHMTLPSRLTGFSTKRTPPPCWTVRFPMENPWKAGSRTRKSLMLFGAGNPSHGRGRRFNPYSAHH